MPHIAAPPMAPSPSPSDISLPPSLAHVSISPIPSKNMNGNFGSQTIEDDMNFGDNNYGNKINGNDSNGNNCHNGHNGHIGNNGTNGNNGNNSNNSNNGNKSKHSTFSEEPGSDWEETSLVSPAHAVGERITGQKRSFSVCIY